MTKNRLLFISLLLWIVSISNLKAQVDYEFWFVAPEVTSGHGDNPVRFVFTAFGQPSTATISMPANGGFTPVVVNVPANGTVNVDMTPYKAQIENNPPASVLNKGILIQATNPITAYYEVNRDNNPDIFTLKGKNALDTEFYIPLQNKFNNQGGLNPAAYAGFDIVATENNTTVTITPTQDLFGHPAGIPFTITLDKGETYFCRSLSQTGTLKPGGTKVVSNKKIAITIKDDSIRTTWGGCYDLLGDQIVGTSQIGFDHVIIKGPTGNNDHAFIYATENNTEIWIDDSTGAPDLILNEGQIHNYNSFPNASTFIHSSKPVYATHLTGYGCEMGTALVPPLGCSGSSEIAFTRSSTTSFSLIILTDSGNINNFTVTNNGANVPINPADFTDAPGTNGKLKVYNEDFANTIVVTNAQTVVSNTKGVFHCGMVNGTGSGCRYGYFSGFRSVQLGGDRPFCDGDTTTLDAGILTEYNWFKKSSGAFNKIDSSRFLNVVDSGLYVVNDNSFRQCFTDTIHLAYHVTTNPGLTPDTSICEKLTFDFTAATIPGFSYLWSTGDTTNSITLIAPDTFRVDTVSVIITDTNGCNSFDTTYTAFDTVKTPKFFGADVSGNLPSMCTTDDTVWVKGSNPLPNYLAYFLGNGIIETDSTDSIAVFDPNLANGGTHQLYFTFIDTSTVGQCSSIDTVGITVFPPINTTPDTALFCNTNPFKVFANPNTNGGDLGEWIKISPNLDTTNFHSTDSALYSPLVVVNPPSFSDTLVYQFTTGSGCVNRDTVFIDVFVFPPVDTLIKTYCADTVGDTAKIIDLTQFDDSLNFGLVLDIKYFSSGSFAPADSIPDPTQYRATDNDTVFVKTVAGGGCINVEGFIVFNVNPLPNPFLGNDTSICSGKSITLRNTPTAGFSFSWSDATTGDSIQENSGGKYWLQKTNSITGCMATDTITVSIDTLPVIDIGADQRICADTVVDFVAGPNDAALSYLWSTGSTNRQITNINIPGIYWAQKTIIATGCQNSDTAILVVDTLPIFNLGVDTSICSFDSIPLTGDPLGSYTYLWGGGSSSDTIFGKPGNTYSLTLATLFGCTSNDEIILIQDNSPPQANCYSDTTIYLDNTGNFTIDSLFIDSASSDNCRDVLLSINRTNFSCADVALPQTVTLTVTDVDGNFATCETQVIVVDTISPIVTCRDTTVYLDSSGVGSTLFEGAQPISFNEDWTGEGANTYFSSTNPSHPSSTTQWNVTGDIDLAEFVKGIPGKEIDLAGFGNGAIQSIQNFTFTPGFYTFSFLDSTNSLGNNSSVQVIIGSLVNQTFVSDLFIQSHSVSFQVKTTEIAPIQMIQLGPNDAGGSFIGNIQLTGQPYYFTINGGMNDLCGIQSIFTTDTTFNCSQVDTNLVALTIVDVNGNSSTCNAQVLVVDTIKPSAFCYRDTTVFLNASGTYFIDSSFVDSASFDACGIATWTLDLDTFSCANVGSNIVTYTITDVNGNSNSCQTNLIVVDSVSPTPLCIDTFLIELDSSGNFMLDTSHIDLGSFDNCGIQSWVLSDTLFSCAKLGYDTVQLTITDFSNNQNTCTSIIQIVDTTKPVLTCVSDTLVYLDSTGKVIIDSSFIDLGSLDNCSLNGWTLTDTLFDCNNLDTNIVIYRIGDGSGNFSECNANIIVVDTLPPTIVAKNDTVWLNAAGNVSFNIINFNRGSFDNCTLTNLVTDINSLNCTDTGFNPVKITATDQSSNQDSLTVQLLVLDSIKPNPICVDTFLIELDSSGNFVLDTSHIDLGSFDNCGIQSWVLSDTLFSCAKLGYDTVQLTVTDFSNNQNSCASIILVVDTTRPSPVCFSDTTVYLDSLGFIHLDSAFVDQGSFDNCGIASWTLSDTTFSCTQIDTFLITYSIFDGSGNSNQCQTSIIVLDTLPPVLQTKNDTLWLDSAGIVSFDFTNSNQGFSDNCSVDSLWTNITALACADTGWNNIQYFGLDVNGNVDSLTVQLLIIDSVAPSLICPADTVVANDSSFCFIVDSFPQPLFGDSCGILSIVNSFNGTAFLNDTFPVDTHFISWTVTDVNGNVSSCAFNLIVEDTELPTISCPNDTAIGFCHDTLVYALPVFNDNCPGFALALDSGLGSGVHFPIGTNTEYYTVTDAHGNSASCSFNVFVDTIPFLQLGPDTAICDYDEVILSAGIPFSAGLDSNFTYLWQDSSTTVEFVANYADTFYVIKTDSFGCSAIDSISLAILTSPNLPFLSDTGICFGDTAVLRAGPDSSIYTYLWADTSGIISNNISISTVDSGFYGVLKVDTTTTCFAADTIFVTVNPLPTPFIGNDTSICEGLAITFDAYNSYERYTWQDSTQAFTYTTDSAGIYSVTVSDFNGCVGVDSLELSIFPNPVVNFSVMHDSVGIVNTDDSSRVCNGVSVTLTVDSLYPTYYWSTGSPNQSINVATSGSYNVLVFDSNNCNANATYKVVVDTLPFVNLGNDTTICNLDSMVIDAGPNLRSYAWSTGDTSQTLQIFTADTFSVVVTDSNSCIGMDTFVLSIDTLPRVSLGPDTTICLRDQIIVSPGTQFASYQWSFFAPDTHSVAISTAGDYWVRVTDANNCSATSDTISLFNDTLPNVQLGPDQGICIGDSVGLDAGPGYTSYQWSNGISVQTQTVNTTGSFVVTVVDANQCIGSDTFNLVVNPLPTVSLGSNKRYCDGVSFNLQLTANSGPPYQSYLWSTAQTGQGITICDQPGACNNVITNFPDTIWVRATDINGCINSDTIVIARGANPVVNIAMSDTSYCSDEVKSIVLDAGPGFNAYAWTKQNAPNFNESGQIILVDTAGTYFINVTDVNGCSGGDVVIIREYQAPNVNLPADTAFCENVAFNLNLNAGAGIGNVYDWNTGETTQAIQASSPGTYTVTVTTPQFCDSEDKITIAQVPLPVSNLENDTLVCSGAFLELDVFNEGYTYLWNTGSLDSAILVDTAGIYSVRLRNKYCTLRDTAFVQYDYVPFIDLGPDSILCQGEVNILDAFFPNSLVSYVWQDGSEDTTFAASFAGNYSVLVTNRCGSFLDNIELFYEDCSNIYAPNSFSPNGDGDNDFYRLYSDQNFTFFELQIFNKGGEPVFQSSSLNVQWDGTFNGYDCPIGAYTYYLRYSSDLDPNGGIYKQVGTVVLIR